jgi:hypothetical protein
MANDAHENPKQPKAPKPVEIELASVDVLHRIPGVGNQTTLAAVEGGMALHLVHHAGALAVRVDRGTEHPVAYVPLGKVASYTTLEDQKALTDRRAKEQQDLADRAAEQRAEARRVALAKDRARGHMVPES